jgi:hypothetical protein
MACLRPFCFYCEKSFKNEVILHPEWLAKAIGFVLEDPTIAKMDGILPDDRLKAVVTSCGFTPFHDYYGGKVAGWTSDRYMPHIRDVYENNADKIPFDFYEVIAALAPRAVFSNSPLHDSNFDITGIRKAFTKASAIYTLLKAEKNLQLVTPDAPHDFPDAERHAAYEWLDQILK